MKNLSNKLNTKFCNQKIYQKTSLFNFCNIQKLADIFKVKKFSTIKSVHEKYDTFNYESDILPTIYQYNTNFPQLDDFLSRVCFLKKKDFFLPSQTKSNIQRFKDLQDYLLENTSLNTKEVVEILFCAPELSNFSSDALIKNTKFMLNMYNISKDDSYNLDIIKNFPKILAVSDQKFEHLIDAFFVYLIKENANLSRNEISEFLKENPLLMTSDLYKIKEHLDFLSKLKKEVIEVCEKNIRKSKVKRIMDREDIEKRIKLGSKVEEDIKLPVEEEILKFSMFDFIKLNPYYLLTSPSNFIEIFTIFKEKLRIDKHLALHIIKRCPDICFINKNKLLNEKIDLLMSMNIDNFTLKQLLKYYPFMLTKSFYSFIIKYEFLRNTCEYKLKGDLDIYPLVLIFDFHKEIKPKLTILKSIRDYHKQAELKQKFSDFSQSQGLNNIENQNYITEKRAFSISKEQFCEEVNISLEEYEKHTDTEWNQMDTPSFPILKEKDLMFYYSKYTYV